MRAEGREGKQGKKRKEKSKKYLTRELWCGRIKKRSGNRRKPTKSGKWILKIKQCKRNKVVRSKSSPDLIPVSKETKSNEQSLVIGMSEDSKLNLI